MPKSFMFTNKRFTSQKYNGNEKSDTDFEGSASNELISSQDNPENTLCTEEWNKKTDQTPEHMDVALNYSTQNYPRIESSLTKEVSRQQHTLPIIKQKERYRSFETNEDNKERQPLAHYSFDTSRESFEYKRPNVEYRSTVQGNTTSPTKICDSSDGESDSGISLISEDSRLEYSTKTDFAYHCSEHLSLLFDFFSPRKSAVREDVVDELPKVRKALDFSMPNIITTGEESTDSNELSNYSALEDEFACVDCGKRYSTSSNLARHRQTHRSSGDKKARQCPHCDKVYVSMPAFSMHVRTHNQGCECPYCGKKFSRPWLLQGHIRTHTGEKPFSCPQCLKCFADKSNLRAHVQTHSSEKPYVCGRCGKAFALKSYLYKHEESSCMRGQRSPNKRIRSSVTEEEPKNAMYLDEHRRSSW